MSSTDAWKCKNKKSHNGLVVFLRLDAFNVGLTFEKEFKQVLAAGI